jgi:Tfp pilus assembly protein PilF/tRNA A-37 threonylcarbamoyl transferase component Bud32
VEKIGRYEIRGELGAGSMGVVYRAWDPKINRIVALKVVNLRERKEELRRKKLQRFYREAELAGGLFHPNIVTILDFRDEEGLPFIVMEYVEGRTLKQVIAEEQSLPLATRLSVLEQLCHAVQYAHERGVIHRDIKPGNILVTASYGVKVTDFSLAKIVTSSGAYLTHTGQVVGTLHYMSPEHFEQRGLGRASDLFSIGVVMYELLTGSLPFDGESVFAIINQIIQEPHPPPRERNPGLPAGIAAIIDRALAKAPEERFASAGEMARALAGERQRLEQGVAAGAGRGDEEPGGGAETDRLDGFEIIREGRAMYERGTWMQQGGTEVEAPSQSEAPHARPVWDPSAAAAPAVLAPSPRRPPTPRRERPRRRRRASRHRLPRPPLLPSLAALLVLAVAGAGVLTVERRRAEQRRLQERLRDVRLCLEFGFPETARAYLDALPAKARAWPGYHLLRARRRLAAGDAAGALRELDALSGEQAESTEVHELRARALLRKGEREAARSLLRQVTAREPENARVHALLGGALLEDGELAAAVEHLRVATELRPEDARPPTRLAECYRRQGKLELAEEYYRLALARDPYSSEANLGLADLLQDAGRLQEAAERIEQVLTWDPLRVDLRLRLAALLLATENRPALERQLALLAVLAPEHPELSRLQAAVRGAAAEAPAGSLLSRLSIPGPDRPRSARGSHPPRLLEPAFGPCATVRPALLLGAMMPRMGEAAGESTRGPGGASRVGAGSGGARTV